MRTLRDEIAYHVMIDDNPSRDYVTNSLVSAVNYVQECCGHRLAKAEQRHGGRYIVKYAGKPIATIVKH